MASPKSGPPAPTPNRPLRALLTFFIPVSLLLGLIYLGYLDFQVRQQFEGKRWRMPVRVYAAPLNLEVGSHLSALQLTEHLDLLNYRADSTLSSQASYYRQGDSVQIRTRAFAFWDHQAPGVYLRVAFKANQLLRIELGTRPAAMVTRYRLDPAHIGSIYPGLREDRLLIRREDVPQPLLQALLATEDRDFFEHHGLSPRGILRALWVNFWAGEVVQGGSTLTQQLAKNLLLSPERTWLRKFNEVCMALILDARYDKEAILEAYLNEIYLGQDGARAIHGFGMASEYYFSRSLQELELQHMALLVALVRGPSLYDPVRFPERAKKRRDRVLDAMAALQFISARQAQAAQQQPLGVNAAPHQSTARYPAFLDLVRRQFQREFSIEPHTAEGLRIFTTLDVRAQAALEAGIQHVMPQLDHLTHTEKQLETAAILMNRRSGQVMALAGGRHPSSSGFNRALDAQRAIGSLYKPVIFLTALESGDYTADSLISDRMLTLENRGALPWRPENYDHQEHGDVTLTDALAHSYNLASVRLGLKLGVARTIKTLHRLGVDRSVEVFPSVLLGTTELTPMEVGQMYLTLANQGKVQPTDALIAAVSAEGRMMQRTPAPIHQGVDAAAVQTLLPMLEAVVQSGTGTPLQHYLRPGQAVAGKTGTTNALRDSWFAGFAGDAVAVVWVGRDDNQPAGLTGAQGALPVWGRIMANWLDAGAGMP